MTRVGRGLIAGAALLVALAGCGGSGESAAKLPDNPEIQYHLGMTYYKLGDPEAARQALGKALALSPRFPGVEEAHRVLAEVR